MPEEHTKDPRSRMLRIKARINQITASIESTTPDLIVTENYEELARLRDLKQSLVETEATLQESIGQDMSDEDFDKFVKALDAQKHIKLGYEAGEAIDESTCHKMSIAVERTEDNGIIFIFEDRERIRMRNQDMHVVQHILNSIL